MQILPVAVVRAAARAVLPEAGVLVHPQGRRVRTLPVLPGPRRSRKGYVIRMFRSYLIQSF